MIQEEKAQAYDEALERAKTILKRGYYISGDIEVIFPELAESEDAKIRKALLEYFSHYGSTHCQSVQVADILTWLEKQGKSSSTIHYWTEEEIEPIISDYLRGAEHYGGMIGRLRCLKPKSLEKQGEQKPITSLDMGPEVLDKVVNDCIFGNEKSAWSEEDEETSRGILNYLCLHDACELEGFDSWYDWLKSSIKNKVQSLSQPKEWSVGDEKMYLSIMSVLLSTIGTDKTSFTVTREIDWLKSLKERYICKPSV